MSNHQIVLFVALTQEESEEGTQVGFVSFTNLPHTEAFSFLSWLPDVHSLDSRIVKAELPIVPDGSCSFPSIAHLHDQTFGSVAASAQFN